MNERSLPHARVELSGPLRELELAPSTRVRGELQAGERAQYSLPCWLPAGEALPREPRLHFAQNEPGLGSARFLGWDASTPELPVALAYRPFPEWASATGALPLSLLVLALAASLCTLALRRPLPALALGCGGALALALFAQLSGPAASGVRLYEGTPGSTAWVQRELGVGTLSLAAPTQGWQLSVEPRSARLALECSLSAAEALRVHSPGNASAQLRGQRLLTGELEAFDARSQSVFALGRVWRRSAEGWSFHGAWERGLALPPAQPGPPPPGWLVQGLPQGVEVYLGELAEAPGHWLRVY
jgi:hypothetical protein